MAVACSGWLGVCAFYVDCMVIVGHGCCWKLLVVVSCDIVRLGAVVAVCVWVTWWWFVC